MKKLNKKWLLNTHKLTLIMTLSLIFSIHSVGARHIDMQHNIYEGAVIKPTVPEIIMPEVMTPTIPRPDITISGIELSTALTDRTGVLANDTVSVPNSTEFFKDTMAQLALKYDVNPETTDLLGDSIDLATGSISFSHTDVSIPGNNKLAVAISRRFHDGNYKVRSTMEFADWSLDVPAIQTTILKGIVWNGAWGRGNECSGVQVPPAVQYRGQMIQPESYWNGTSLLVGGSREPLLYVGLPTQTYTTKNHWTLTCYTRADNAGEGFLAISPDGTQYRFDVPHIVKDFNASGDVYWPLYQAYLRVSSITDRFNNRVEYNYIDHVLPSGLSAKRLTSIVGYENNVLDGRRIDITYNTGEQNYLIDRVIANNKTYQYDYEQPNGSYPVLTTVTLPKTTSQTVASKWQYDLKKLNFIHNYHVFDDFKWNEKTCQRSNDSLVGTVTHPDGIVGTFTLKPTIHYRSMAPKSQDFYHANRIDCFATIALKTKKLSGKGVSNLTWQYSYSSNEGSYDDSPNTAVAPTYSNVDYGYANTDLKNTIVTAPDNSKTVHIFTRRWNYLENTEVSTLWFNTASSTKPLQKSQSTFYRHFPFGAGILQGALQGNFELDRSRGLLKEKKITSYDVSTNAETDYETIYGATTRNESAPQFTKFGMPLFVTEIYNDHKTRVSKNTYHNDETMWVLNLPLTRSVLDDNNIYQEISRTQYYQANSASPWLAHKHYRFNQLHLTTTYHPNGMVLKQQAGNLTNRTVEYGAYYRGKPTSFKLPGRLSGQPSFSGSQIIDDNGQVTAITDFNQQKTYYHYDTLGRMTLIDPVNTTLANTTISYTENTGSTYALLQSITRANYRKDITLDGLMRPILTHEWDSANTATTRYIKSDYNAYNKPTCQSYPTTTPLTSASDCDLLPKTTYNYDGLQRLVLTKPTGLGSIITDYLADNKKKVTDGEYHQTTTTYLAYGSPSYQQPLAIDSPENLTTLTVNAFGNVTRITQSGGGVSDTQINEYNSYQQLCMVKRSDVGHTYYQRNTLGEVQWQAQGVSGTSCSAHQAAANQKTTLSYDNLGALHRASYGDGTPPLTYSYDNLGNIKTLTSGNVQHTYEHYANSALKSEKLTLSPNKELVLAYNYNSLGHLTQLTYPNEGPVVNITTNAFGEPTKVYKTGGNYATNATYHSNGALAQFTYGNGAVHSMTLNTAQLPARLSDTQGSTALVNYQYQYDNNANITRITDNVNTAYSVTHLTYDGLDRLRTTSGGTGIGSSNIQYDALGNIKTYSSKGKNLTYQYTNNRLTSLTGTGLDGRVFNDIAPGNVNSSYDKRGNVINNGKHHFTYNLANQMIAADSYQYTYDGHNRRVKQIDSKGISYSMYSQSGVLLYRETRSNGQAEPVNYIYLGNKLIAKDGIIADADSTARHSRPFGDSIETPKDDIGYTGHKFDTDLDLSYMQARYYDPVIGRFYSNDPVGFKNVHNFNRYAYANNNPYKYIDPDGQDAYLVSRPLKLPVKANHNFIVYNAKSVGDPNATVRSFGDTGNDTMGEVNGDTKGFSEGTLQGDTDAWQSLSGEGSGVTYRKIDASDSAVAKVADSLKGGQEYSAVPEVQGGVNSNTAAGAIANKADGGFTFVNNGRSQPGSTVTDRVEFKEEKINEN